MTRSMTSADSWTSTRLPELAPAHLAGADLIVGDRQEDGHQEERPEDHADAAQEPLQGRQLTGRSVQHLRTADTGSPLRLTPGG